MSFIDFSFSSPISGLPPLVKDWDWCEPRGVLLNPEVTLHIVFTSDMWIRFKYVWHTNYFLLVSYKNKTSCTHELSGSYECEPQDLQKIEPAQVSNIEEGGAPEVLPIAEELGNVWLLDEGGLVLFWMQSLIGDWCSDRQSYTRVHTDNAKRTWWAYIKEYIKLGEKWWGLYLLWLVLVTMTKFVFQKNWNWGHGGWI